MEIGKIKISELISPEWNPRTISETDMEKLKNSIKEFDYVDPIIVNKHNNHIVGGNQRYYALKELGYEEIDVVFIDEPDLNKEKALNIALNKISGEWDNVKLEDILQELSQEELDLTGFDELELGYYLDVDLDFDNPFDYDDEEEEEFTPDDMVEDIEGDRTNEQFVVSISFRTKERANEFLNFIEAPYELTQRSVGIHDDEIKWGEE